MSSAQHKENPAGATEKLTSEPGRLDGFTLKLTEFNASGDRNFFLRGGVQGLRYPNWHASCANATLPFLGINSKIALVRTNQQGLGVNFEATVDYTVVDIYVWRQGSGGRREDVIPSPEILRDLFGADAISKIVETPQETLQRQLRAAIVDALAKSNGDTMQAAARLHMSEGELLQKAKEFGIAIPKR